MSGITKEQYNKAKSKFYKYTLDEDIVTDCAAIKLMQPHRLSYHIYVDVLRSRNTRIDKAKNDGQQDGDNIFFEKFYDPFDRDYTKSLIQKPNQEALVQLRMLFKDILSRQLVMDGKVSVRRLFFKKFILGMTFVEIAKCYKVKPYLPNLYIKREIARINDEDLLVDFNFDGRRLQEFPQRL